MLRPDRDLQYPSVGKKKGDHVMTVLSYRFALLLVLGLSVSPLSAESTLTVCERGCDFRSLEVALESSRPGYTIEITIPVTGVERTKAERNIRFSWPSVSSTRDQSINTVSGGSFGDGPFELASGSDKGGSWATLCHIPPGNPQNAQTIQLGQGAVPGHLAHGDLLGECPYECDGVPSPVAQTGQTGCWDVLGNSIDCAGTGQDGEYQAGASVDPRFTDNGDGTVRDNLTGLIWLQDADCFGRQIWPTALSSANTLADGSCALMDGSVAGDWRLPNLRELQSLTDYQTFLPPLPTGHPFSGVQSRDYWSSTTHVTHQSFAWSVYLVIGHINIGSKTNFNNVWPVRSGQ